ncbi:MAG: glutamine-hydrolyzing GMP synthase [Armatimonadetes bacterium]|nr:glutamine-hydrolyzing GMP synthase [Armatimonadota bacterium]MDW8121593.1 glutamine-hydrolyzing GMP synthase [Armatimonadota bacterium]
MGSRPDDFVVVLDFGAQYGQLIARRVRECRVYSEILPCDLPLEKVLSMRPKGIILSGGQASVYDPDALTYDPRLFSCGIPVLGICYGMQLMAYLLGGQVTRAEKAEYGRTELTVLDDSDLFKGLNPQLICWMSHSDVVLKPPPGFTVTARTANAPVAAMSDQSRCLFGTLFHPEVTHTPWGVEIIRNFLYDWCQCRPVWTPQNFVQSAIEEVRSRVKNGQVLCALSGGVDSATTAALVYNAVGDQLISIFVNHGFLRKGEAESVLDTFRTRLKIPVIYVDASERFLKAIKGVTDPEEKRQIIGKEFVRVFEEEARKLGRVRFLAQGTLYPDVIESGTGYAARIKSHHNVAGLPPDMELDLIEPLRYLFKDEVREVAEELGLPPEIAWRQPFPGPGLAIRIIGEVTGERLALLREADAIVMEEIRRAGLYRQLWQAFAVLLPVRSTGIKGDRRTYGYTIVLRAVHSEDGMTADWARLPYEVLDRIAVRISNEVNGINRVVYDITSKPPATIEWE